jgi:hypothetical protein
MNKASVSYNELDRVADILDAEANVCDQESVACLFRGGGNDQVSQNHNKAVALRIAASHLRHMLLEAAE